MKGVVLVGRPGRREQSQCGGTQCIVSFFAIVMYGCFLAVGFVKPNNLLASLQSTNAERLCLRSAFVFTTNSPTKVDVAPPVPPPLADADDVELMRRATLASPETGSCKNKKVAFLFLTRGRIPLRQLWERFFNGHEELYSIYLHASPNSKEESPETSVFFNRRIPSKEVQWGRVTVVDAERRLLANALLDDKCNDRFILLSESCIPLHNFTIVHSYLVSSSHSHINSFDDQRRAGRGRYNRLMGPAITLQNWRKGSQWFEVHRRLAVEIVSDDKYYPLFRRHCRPPCYVDEHYFPTWVGIVFPEMNSGRTLTWVDWSKGGSHPATFRGRHVTGKLLGDLRSGRRCNYTNDGLNTSVCFLFARKFDGSSLGPLMRIAPKMMGFN